MKRNTTLCALAVSLLLAALTTTRLNAQTTDPDQRLRALLVYETPTKAQLMALDSIQTQLGGRYNQVLGDIAADASAPELTRGHALSRLGQNFAFMPAAFAQAMADRSVLVRAYAAQALRPLLALNDSTVAKLLIMALHDSDERVQSKALESIGDREPEALIAWLAEKPGPNAQLRGIAQQLIDVAQDRGAPLQQVAGTNVLQRVSNGVTIRYTPRQSWPDWDASVGTLTVGRTGTKPIDVAVDVEAVDNVVPAYVSGDGKTLVYEDSRNIHWRDLASGVDRVISPGIAPRPFPFTDSFIFLRPETKPLIDDPVNGTQLFYEVMRMPFSGSGKPELIGQLTAATKKSLHGAYSPARWMRVHEVEGAFWLEGEGVSAFKLPDPFGTTARAIPKPR